jgi:hypothetical protein
MLALLAVFLRDAMRDREPAADVASRRAGG